jgi:hypothetical protein
MALEFQSHHRYVFASGVVDADELAGIQEWADAKGLTDHGNGVSGHVECMFGAEDNDVGYVTVKRITRQFLSYQPNKRVGVTLYRAVHSIVHASLPIDVCHIAAVGTLSGNQIMNLVRRYSHELDIEPPHHISVAYNAGRMHDELSAVFRPKFC